VASSPIVAFYQARGTDNRGRSLSQLQALDFSGLEDTHDFIQWLFPLDHRSSFNRNAPILSPDDIRTFLGSEDLQAKLLDSLRAMLSFYGLGLEGEAASPRVVRSATFANRAANWITPNNHNFLRLTRILLSLKLLGCRPYAQALLQCLEGIYSQNSRTIGDVTLRYWRNAINP
jgi:hypothetical protein